MVNVDHRRCKETGVGIVMSTKLDIVSVIFIGVSSVSIQNMIWRINGVDVSVRTLNLFLQRETLAQVTGTM